MSGKASPAAARRASRKYYAKNAEEIKRRAREHRAENAAAVRKYRATNIDAIRKQDREKKRGKKQFKSQAYRLKANARMREIVNPGRYGLTLSAIEAMMAEQGGICAICTRKLGPYSKTVHVDHCHKTGINRGILCTGCNTGIGQFLESTEILQRAIDYLVKHGAVARPLPELQADDQQPLDDPQQRLFH